jgi:hypothetical protein
MVTINRKKAALYLASQGTCRDQRVLDLHYSRIFHHSDRLKAILDNKIDIVSTYCDFSCHRQDFFQCPENFPGLKSLVNAFSRKDFEIVLLDLEFGRPYHPHEWDLIVSELKESGIPVYKTFPSETQTPGQGLASRFETTDEFGVFSFGAEDFVTLFPALAYAMVEEL